MAYIFIVKYSVLFGLINFGLGFGLLNLASASTSASRLWPRPRPRGSGLGLDLSLKCLASASALASSIWPRLTSLVATDGGCSITVKCQFPQLSVIYYRQRICCSSCLDGHCSMSLYFSSSMSRFDFCVISGSVET